MLWLWEEPVGGACGRSLWEEPVLYLAVVHGGGELVGAQRQLGLLVEVHPAPNVVQVLEVEHRHWGHNTHPVRQTGPRD